MSNRRQALLALASTLLVPSLKAQDIKPLRIIVPFAAGGSSDAMARLLGSHLQTELQRSVVVENVPGASGILAAKRLLGNAPDGTMLLNISPTSTIILPRTFKLDFDPLADFVPVSNMGSNPLMLAVHKSVPATTLGEFIAYAKSQPPMTMSFASGGTGTSTHLIAELFFKRAGLHLTHVPYKGGSLALNDLLGGHVQCYFGNPADFLQQMSGDAIRLLATSGDKRLPEAPNVPTLSETIPGLSLVTWNGLAFRKGTAQAGVDQMSLAIQKVSRQPEYVAGLAKLGVAAIGDTPQLFAASINRDRPLWNEAIDVAGIKQE